MTAPLAAMVLATVAPGKSLVSGSGSGLVQYGAGDQLWLTAHEYKLKLREGLVLNPDGSVPTSAGVGYGSPAVGEEDIPDNMRIAG